MSASHNNFVKPIVTLVIISLLSAFILGYVHNKTQTPIKQAKDNQELAAISEVVGEFDNNPFTERMFIFTKDKKHKLTMYPARKNGALHSVAIKTHTNAGFGGTIEIMAGFRADGSIKNFKIISSNETPGLGSKIDEPKFKEQFNGFHPERQILKVRQDGGDIDAVTAATISSRAVLKALQRAYNALSNFNSGGISDE